ncbi:cupin domain-containing protein [Streptomyces sp. NPDC051985]|uniref:cupin domain-containing protein n=1 Tax=Streptomyces sp. NPDC051985 TaxID=3155807 RepID=UPI00342B7759
MDRQIRRVVTGETSEGKSVFTHDEVVHPVGMGGGSQWYGVWGWDETPALPFHRPEPFEQRSVFPGSRPAGGTRINLCVFPPGYGVVADGEPPSEDFLRLASAEPAGMHDDGTGMHRTDTLDLCVLVSGEITVLQHDGAEVTLHPGDLLVQNGAMHSWQNRGDVPCEVYIVNVGTARTA